MKFIKVSELKEKLDNGVNCTVLDIREPYEVNICRIDSLHIPMASVPSRVKELPKEHELVVLCKSGNRAQAVANLLMQDFNMNNVSVLEGGILAWIEEVDTHLEAY